MAVNNLAVLVAAIAGMVVGSVWFALFGKTWMKLAKITSKPKKGMGKSYLGQFVSLLVTAYVLAIILGLFNATTVGAGISAAFWIWLGFVATETFGGVLWSGTSLKLWLFENLQNFISLAVMASIIAVWM